LKEGRRKGHPGFNCQLKCKMYRGINRREDSKGWTKEKGKKPAPKGKKGWCRKRKSLGLDQNAFTKKPMKEKKNKGNVSPEQRRSRGKKKSVKRGEANGVDP